ncbi:MAG: hypothetical protein ABSA75_07310 [Candidatus Bathyarchaeia archaeon]|jgi:hypothetical protein
MVEMETGLKTFLNDNKDLIDAVVETENGWIVRLPLGFLNSHDEVAFAKFRRFVFDIARWKADWLGPRVNGFFIPSLTKNIGKCVETSLDSQSEKDLEAAFLKLRAAFAPKSEIQNAILFLLRRGLTPAQIAAKVGASQASIYRLSSLKKNSKLKQEP